MPSKPPTSSRCWKRWKRLVSHPLDPGAGDMLGDPTLGMLAPVYFSACQRFKKLLHVSDTVSTLLFATVTLYWFENKTGIPNCQGTLASFHCIEEVSYKTCVPQCEL